MINIKIKRYALLVLIVLSISFFLIIGYCNYSQTRETAAIRDCKSLNLGMTKEEVISIMGEPISVISDKKNGKTKLYLVFYAPRAASTAPCCVIDSMTNIVEMIVCDEDYEIFQDSLKN